ncbi:hypothetical protein E4634_12840 [Mangrovimicrobium sediminis]|uniref:PilZ domain-containing protein n=1 Tax=Mangrovimicrobium sediminis TaxID=2562682 RepID=A0A4Z0M139_9GAMM|nr:PilZ domain-containing protein [Haliea sp. SAOS-164]TGD73156.1 hypothetical protein E4634_12840 [Haliea sp. SAOS-164]
MDVTLEENPGEVQRWLGVFQEARGAVMGLAEGDGECFPVVVRHIAAGEPLLVDVGSVPFARSAFEAQRPVQLSSFGSNAQVTTSAEPLLDLAMAEGKLTAKLAYPQALTVKWRRNEFRAVLRHELVCKVTLRSGHAKEPLVGTLRDLSMGGCQVVFPPQAVYLDDGEVSTYDLNLKFAGGDDLSIRGILRHCEIVREDSRVRAGFQFESVNHAQDRQLWYFVREIEREHARGAQEDRERPASPLFATDSSAAPEPAEAPTHATSMAHRLSAVATSVGVQLRLLKQGEKLDGSAISRAADTLLRLLEADREEVLFALICLPEQPPVVRHGVAVATRLADIGISLNIPRDALKGMTTCALLHDLGAELRGGGMTPAARAEQVFCIADRLREVRWLSPVMIAEVVEQINERLDGRGYPLGLEGNKLSELSKLAAVVNTIDAACRINPEGGEETFGRVATRLATQEAAYSAKWVKLFFERYGALPVGARVAAPDGERYWVRRLDECRRVAQLVPCADQQVPSAELVARSVQGEALADIGELREVTAGL